MAIAAGLWAWRSDIELQAAPARGAISGTVTLTEEGEAIADRSNLVVYLQGVPDALPDTSNIEFEIRQKNKQFQTPLLVALKGSTVSFPNDDKIFHNVFSLSRTARFDLGLYKSGESKAVKMKRVGEVDVYCNIHPEMVSKILVLDTRYYAVTDRNGRFSIDGVPPGEYGVVGWLANGTEYKGRTRVEANKTTQLEIAMVRKPNDQGHTRKDGTPYGRYE